MAFPKRKTSILNQFLLVLISIFSLVILFSLFTLIDYHNRNQKAKFEDYAKTIGVSLSHYYQQAIAEVDIGKIIIHNSEVLGINEKILYISVNLNDYDKLIFCDKHSKWKEVEKIKLNSVYNTGKIILHNENRYQVEDDVYEYLYPITQLETNLGWFQIGVDISEDKKEFKSFLTGIIFAEILLFLILALVSYYFARRTTYPIVQLHDSVLRFSEGEKNVSVKVNVENEIADLAHAFNLMTKRISEINEELELKVNERTKALEESIEKLKEAQELARDSAMQAGMAEIATNVLHNVGNVLNSVNVSAGAINEILRSNTISNLPKIANLLLQNKEKIGEFLQNDARGKLIPDFINELANGIMAERALLINELDRLIVKVNSIKEIIILQQDYASRSEIKSVVDIKDLIHDSILIAGLNVLKSKINLKVDVQVMPKLTLNKHKVVQILVNLMKNSKEALMEVDDIKEKNILIEAQIFNDLKIRISVADNGGGISPEAMSRIFEHGFTTKIGGHGFGLHGAANDAKKMGGQLFCESKGKGFGAKFTLELPFEHSVYLIS